MCVRRHCACVYYQDWHRTQPIRAPTAANFKPGVHRLPLAPASSVNVRESIFGTQAGDSRINGDQSRVNGASSRTNSSQRGLPFDEESKLVYGVVLSLRNMVKKLSGK